MSRFGQIYELWIKKEEPFNLNILTMASQYAETHTILYHKLNSRMYHKTDVYTEFSSLHMCNTKSGHEFCHLFNTCYTWYEVYTLANHL